MKNILKLIGSVVLSAISAYFTYILLLVLDIVHYYELTEHPSENIESDLALLIPFILFNILYSIIFFRRNRKITVDKNNNK